MVLKAIYYKDTNLLLTFFEKLLYSIAISIYINYIRSEMTGLKIKF